MKKHILTAILYTLVTTALLGIGYPLAMTLLAHALMPYQATGEMIRNDGVLVGSRLIGQPFTGPGYFHSRPSAAGAGYDAANSSGSNLAPTNATLVQRVAQSVQSIQASRAAAGQAQTSNAPVPVDLVTTSASGLDPDISVAAAEYQVSMVARARGMEQQQVMSLVRQHIAPRQLGVLGEPRVNVLELNLALDAATIAAKSSAARSR